MSNAFRPSSRSRPRTSRKPLYSVPSRLDAPANRLTKPNLVALPNRPPQRSPHPGTPPVRRFPPRPLPIWLKGLLGLQRLSLIAVLALAAVTLTIYGSTVYVQQRWGDGFHRLNKLQRNERQFVAAGEILKNQLAKQGEQADSGMVPKTTNNTFLLQPAPSRQPATGRLVTPASEPSSRKPLGY